MSELHAFILQVPSQIEFFKYNQKIPLRFSLAVVFHSKIYQHITKLEGSVESRTKIEALKINIRL